MNTIGKSSEEVDEANDVIAALVDDRKARRRLAREACARLYAIGDDLPKHAYRELAAVFEDLC